MQPMNDDGLGVEAQAILRETLQSLERGRVQRLIGNASHCLDTDCVRRIAAVAAGATVHEQRHAMGCQRCQARVRAFQNAKEATPERTCDESLRDARNASVPLIWVLFVEKQARHLFDTLLRERESETVTAREWLASDAVADELRHACSSGASDSESAHLVGTLLGPVAAISRDVLSPWSADFDSAWPIFELLRQTAKEAARAGTATRDQFISSYARIAAGAPTHLKAVLVDGIEYLAGSAAEDGDRDLAAALTEEIAMVNVSEETQTLLDRSAGAPLDPAIRPDVTPDEIADLVAATLRSLFEGLLSAPDDPFELLSRLRTIRRYLSDLVSSARALSAEHRSLVLRAAAEPLIHYAHDDRSSVFLAMEASRALAGESLAYANVLSAMLATGRPELLHAVVVGLRAAFESMVAAGSHSTPRYERRGAIWLFVGVPSHPLHETAAEVARLAGQHAGLADSIEWFNHRFEPTVRRESVPVPAR